MAQPHLIIIGGGVAGLSAGCFALANGLRVSIFEHNLALGGVCTSWRRGDYVVDGCIHWLTGGPFMRLYEELGIVPKVEVRVLDEWIRYRHVGEDVEVPVTRDLGGLFSQLIELAPEDRKEIERIRENIDRVVAVEPPLDAPELTTIRERVRALWDMRGSAGVMMQYRSPLGAWAQEHIQSELIRRLFTHLVPSTAPAMFLLMILGYLERGYLSRPVGGTAAFRDALVSRFHALGGAAMVNATVDEVLVEGDRARGVRLADGTMVEGDIVISTSSAPETVLRLLGGRYDAKATRERLEQWPLFQPIVLASFGVSRPFANAAPMQVIDGISPFEVGGFINDYLYVRVCNDDSSFAPPGHTVIQSMLGTTYEWWAKRGTEYGAAKDDIGRRIAAQLDRHFPGLAQSTEMVDLATPLTYWHMARSWRGAFEGWMPTANSFMSHVPKTLHGLSGLYMSGQWVEPGGGIPMAAMSGRQVVELVCHDLDRPFRAETGPA